MEICRCRGSLRRYIDPDELEIYGQDRLFSLPVQRTDFAAGFQHPTARLSIGRALRSPPVPGEGLSNRYQI